MKQQIRRGVFETNSSSTHSICITKNDKYTKPKSIWFDFGEFGQERDIHCSTFIKADYLYTGLYESCSEQEINEYKENIKNFLESEGIDCVFKGEGKTESYTVGGKVYTYPYIDGYVDHGCELKDFIDDVCTNKDKLFRFLFSSESFIITGNDNDDFDVDINVSYDHDEYYKGN